MEKSRATGIKRWRFRFTLRMLLIFATLEGVALCAFMVPGWTKAKHETAIKSGDYSILYARPAGVTGATIQGVTVLDTPTTIWDWLLMRRMIRLVVAEQLDKYQGSYSRELRVTFASIGN